MEVTGRHIYIILLAAIAVITICVVLLRRRSSNRSSGYTRDLLTGLMDDPNDEPAKKHVNRYLLCINMFRAILIAIVAVALAIYYVTGYMSYALIIVFLVFAIAWSRFKYKGWVFSRITYDQCDPVRAADEYWYLIQRASDRSYAVAQFWNLCQSLRYSGRHEQALQIMERTRPLIKSPREMLLYYQLKCDVAFDTGNLEMSRANATAIERLLASNSIDSKRKALAQARVTRAQMLEIELAGQSEQAETIWQTIDSSQASKQIRHVEARYHLGLLKKASGDDAAARGYFSYVVEHGGSTWFATKAREMLDNSNIAEQ